MANHYWGAGQSDIIQCFMYHFTSKDMKEEEESSLQLIIIVILIKVYDIYMIELHPYTCMHPFQLNIYNALVMARIIMYLK